MQATLLQVLHAPAHAHALRGTPGHETAADERGFSQALTSASERIDGSLHDAPDPAGAQADHGEASQDTEDVPDRAATSAQADTRHAKDSDAAASLPVWLAGLTRRAEPAAQASPTGRVESGADAPSLPTPAGAAANGMSRQVRPGMVRPDARGANPARGTGSLPDDAGNASAALRARKDERSPGQGMATEPVERSPGLGMAAEPVERSPGLGMATEPVVGPLVASRSRSDSAAGDPPPTTDAVRSPATPGAVAVAPTKPTQTMPTASTGTKLPADRPIATPTPVSEALSTPVARAGSAENQSPSTGTGGAVRASVQRPDDASARAASASATVSRSTLMVEGERVTVELRPASAAPSRANAPQDGASDRSGEALEGVPAVESVPVGSAPDAVARKSLVEAAAREDRGADRTVAAASAAMRRHAADTEPRPRDATGTANAPAPEARAVSTRARSPEEGNPATDALPGAPATGRPPEPVPATARAQESGAAQITRAPESNPSTTTPAALPTGVTPQQPATTLLASRWRSAAGPATPGEGVRALAAPAERLRQEMFIASGPGDAQIAPRLPGLEAGSAPAATQASSWIQALETATRQAGGDSLRAGTPEMPAPPGVPAATVEAGGRPEPSSPTEGMPSSRIDAPPDSPQFPGMLGARVATMVRDGIEQARIALNPQEMGPVSVQIEMSGTQVRVDLAAEVEATRLALEQALPALAGSLREAGFTLAGGGVFQQARDGSQGQPAEGGSASGGSLAPRPASAEAAAPSRARMPQGIVDLYA